MYTISLPLDDEPGEFEEVSFPDTGNMYGFLDLLLEDGKDYENVVRRNCNSYIIVWYVIPHNSCYVYIIIFK